MRARLPLSALLLLLACSDPAPAPSPSPEESEPQPAPLAQEESVEALEETRVTLSAVELEPPARRAPSTLAEVVARPAGATLSAPEGFRVQRVADDLGNADALALDRTGVLHVVDRAGSRIHRLEDADGDGVAEGRAVFADAENGLDQPGALVFTPGACFVAQRAAVMRHALPDGQTALQGTGGRVASFPADATAGGPSLVLSPDRRHLYIGIGAGARARRPDPLAGTVMEINFSGSQRRTFATGLYDAALAFHGSGALVAAVAERPDVSNAPALLTRVADAQFYGWPSHLAGPDRADPNASGQGPPPTASDALLPPGSRPRAIAFIGSGWPERYRGAALVALAGSAERAPSVISVRVGDDGAPGEGRVFLSGWTTDGGAWGRPSGLAVHRDGSVFVSDGPGGRVFRVVPPE